MAIIALHSAATGLNALSTQIDVISHNLANLNNHGFKSFRTNFEDLIYQDLAQPGVETASGTETPVGIQVGLGVKVSNTDLDFSQGAALNTNRPLDMMINGEGFFRIQREDSPGGVAYTRDGNFFVNSDSELVFGNRSGFRVDPPISVPDQTTDVTITSDGQIQFRNANGQISTEEIQITTFINPKGLLAIGGDLFEQTEASGDPVDGTPDRDGRGEIIQGHREASNVDPVRELVELIKAQRAFELNSQSIQTADEALSVVSNLRRF